MTAQAYDYDAILSSIDHDAYHYGTGSTTPRTFTMTILVDAPTLVYYPALTCTFVFQAGAGSGRGERTIL